MKRLVTYVLLTVAVPFGVVGTASGADARHRDRRPPRVTISTPGDDATVPGVFQVSGTARDDRAVRRVTVSVDGGPFALADGTKSWHSAVSLAEGEHTIVVHAADRTKNVGTDVVTVTVGGSETPATPASMTAPEGTQIDVDSAGAWTPQQIHQLLLENGLDEQVGSTLTVKVQDVYPSQLSSAHSSSGGQTTFSATMYLKGVDSSFASTPAATLAHEYGHAWSLYHLYMSQGGDWSSYLDARGLTGDARLETSHAWAKAEIIADDYRLLFGSSDAIAQRPAHLNAQIADPRDVQGLRAFLEGSWTT